MHSTFASDDELTGYVVGAAIEVHRCLGSGLGESVYQDALETELQLREIPYRRQVRIPVNYKGRPVGTYVLDLVVMDILIVELKAIDQLAAIHYAQVRTYLRAAALTMGLLINFNVPLLRDGVRRIVSSERGKIA